MTEGRERADHPGDDGGVIVLVGPDLVRRKTRVATSFKATERGVDRANRGPRQMFFVST
ncbi:MAG: hypothetical protein HOQ11_03325 [Gemmatimonadaceae bacterium]|nr:hypothetical protein [Gemmatimonadaceae bacterium]NUQ93861.1 hypothetical protein [Gemmatimonadaceae bacterium]NUR20539.1 hypothetical protein [Gemmatimonadaceae bacterium]NUS96421.1 hypothetical protein [Gemmatimonadaceae bacterium]